MDNPTRRRFIIVGMARSGTTVTHQALQGHPNVRSNMDEVKVAPFFTQGVAAFTVSGSNDYERDNGYGLLIDALSMIPGHLRGPHVMGFGGTDGYPKREILANGLKVAVFSAAEAESLVGAMSKFRSLRDVAIIRVVRRDLVAQFASLQRALRSGIWHSFYQTGATVEDPYAPFEIPEEEFEEYCHQATRTRAAFDRLSATHAMLEVSYEDIVELGQEAFGRLFAFLDLPVLAPTWIYSKKVAPPVASFVRNADRLYQALHRLAPTRSRA